MADSSQFYPGTDAHPIDESLVARMLDHRAFAQSGGTVTPPATNTAGYQLAAWARAGQQFSTTSTTITLPDGSTWTPSGEGITPENADARYVRYDTAAPIMDNTTFLANAGISVEGTGTSLHPRVGVTESQDFVSFDQATQQFTFSDVNLAADVTGTLPVANINPTELNNAIDARASQVGSVHSFDNNTFPTNTVTWDVGDILIYTPDSTAPDVTVTYLFTGTRGTSTDLDDFTQITVAGGGISEAAADARYVRVMPQTLSNTEQTQVRTNIGLGTAATSAATDFATANHNHDTRYARFDAAMPLTDTQRSTFFSNVGAFSGLAYGGEQIQGFTASLQTLYVLQEPAAPVVAQLPAGEAGAQIIFIATRSSSRNRWTVQPATGERIQALPIDEGLVVNVDTTPFTLTYTSDTFGWAIT